MIFACNKEVLVEKPRSLVVEHFYNTDAEVQSAIAAIYPALRGQFGGNYMCILECQTEYGGGFIVSQGFDSHRMLNGLAPQAINSYVSAVWDALYTSIRNANLVIHYTPQSKVLSADQIDKAVAEAKFLRAFSYFYLVRNWSGVPIYNENNFDQTSGVGKSTEEQVYDFITEDLAFATEKLDDAPLNLGRPSKWAAKTMLSDVYFFRQDYSKAMSLAKDVMESGKFRLEEVSKTDDFDKIFGPNPTSLEEIFYFRYNLNSPSNLLTYTLPRIEEPWWSGTAYGMFYITKEHLMYRNWNSNDLRKQFTWFVTEDNRLPSGDPWYPFDSETILAPKKYTAPGTTVATNPFPAYRYSYILLLYAEASARISGNPTVDGIEALNMVHRRAYGYNSQHSSPVDFKGSDFANLDLFLDKVLEERGYEFQFEGKRWFDLVRTGKAAPIIKEYEGRVIAEKAYLWPIPPLEMDLNEALSLDDQNPGY